MKRCKICNNTKLKKKFEYKKKPKSEKSYSIVNYKKYHRFYYICKKCKHYSAFLNMKLKDLYSSEYNNTIYQNGLKKNFIKIINLPNSESDNYFRVKRIDKFIKKIYKKKKIKVLDIGSGLGVFPYKINQKKNYDCTALDPDKKSCKHIYKYLGIKCINGNFLSLNIKKKYNLITLNKVIEHVKSPQLMLRKARHMLSEKGILYIEVPHISASKLGKNREEFHIDHLHIFSKKSLILLATKVKLKTLLVKTIIEPSGKFSVYGFFSLLE